MLVRETIERCGTCSELTPHSRRIVALPWLISLALLLGAAWCSLVVPDLAPLGVVLLPVVVGVVLFDRRQRWDIRCERCRWKGRAKQGAKRRRLGFTLGRNTVTNWF